VTLNNHQSRRKALKVKEVKKSKKFNLKFFFHFRAKFDRHRERKNLHIFIFISLFLSLFSHFVSLLLRRSEREKTFTFIYILASHNKRFCNIKKERKKEKTLTRLLSNLEDLKALHKNSNTSE
jgi:hypothetical protein